MTCVSTKKNKKDLEMEMTGVTIKTYLIEGWAHQK